MKILLVDDSDEVREVLARLLRESGFKDVLTANGAAAAYETLGVGAGVCGTTDFDLIIMDIIMPGIDGIEALRTIKSDERLRDVPVIMVTALDDEESLKMSFEAGAVDYITKPIRKMELVSRARAILRLKHEMDKRKQRERELVDMARTLEEANRVLQGLSYLDSLTNIANRRYFDDVMVAEWRRSIRDCKELSIAFIDVDDFKAYNDTYGHMAGDDCLKGIAGTLKSMLQRPADFVARYGGEEFVIVMPDTPRDGARRLLDCMRKAVVELAIEHKGSCNLGLVTVSAGIASIDPEDLVKSPGRIVHEADQALYRAKAHGKNRVEVFIEE